MIVVAPPDATEWWDVADIALAVRRILRLGVEDVDAARIDDLVPAAGQRINVYLDRADAVPGDADDPVLRAALIDATVAMYRTKDSPPASPDLAFGLGYQPADPLSQVRPQLTAAKHRWGVG